MKKIPGLSGRVAAATKESVPVTFANQKIYKEYLSIVRQMVLAQAADAHPSWSRTGNGGLERGGKTGPETAEALTTWFEKHHPKRVAELSEAVRRAVHVKHGIKPPKVKSVSAERQ